MTVEEIKAVVHECSKITWPESLKPGNELGPREKIEALEDFMLVCAEARNFCENGRIIIAEALKDVRAEWDAITGWEPAIRGSVARATKQDIEEAKATIRPDLLPSLREGEFLLRRLNEQIARFAKNEETVSRLYTFSVGTG